MKRHIIIASAFAMAIAFSACSKNEHASHKQETAKLSADYPLDVCVVSGEKLSGQMGATVVINHNGQEVGLCCKDCEGDFQKNPEKYIAIINEAKAKKSAPAAQ